MQIHTADWFSPMSEKEMFEKFSVDSERRDATKLKHNVRPTTMKNAQWEAVQVNNYQTTLQLDRKYPEFFESMEEYIKKFIKTVPEVYPYNTQEARGAIDKIHREHSDILNATFYADVHFDKPSDLPMLMNKEQKNAKHKEWWTGHRHKDITQSFHWMQVNTVWAVSSGGDRNDKYWVDHINNQLFGVLYHKKDWKVAQFYEKI